MRDILIAVTRPRTVSDVRAIDAPTTIGNVACGQPDDAQPIGSSN